MLIIRTCSRPAPAPHRLHTTETFRYQIEQRTRAARYESMSIDFILGVLIKLEHENRMIFIVYGCIAWRIG